MLCRRTLNWVFSFSTYPRVIRLDSHTWNVLDSLILNSKNKIVLLFTRVRVISRSSNKLLFSEASKKAWREILMEKCFRANGVLFLYIRSFAKFPHSYLFSLRFSIILLLLLLVFSVTESNQHSSHRKIQLLRIEQLLNDSERDYLSNVRVHCIISWHFLLSLFSIKCALWLKYLWEKNFFRSIFTRQWKQNILSTKYTEQP